jgi:hypothetical protein
MGICEPVNSTQHWNFGGNIPHHTNAYMKWFSSREKVPDDQQEVLVRKKGLVSLAKYDKARHAFRLRQGDSIALHTEHIEWMELVAPEPNRE